MDGFKINLSSCRSSYIRK